MNHKNVRENSVFFMSNDCGHSFGFSLFRRKARMNGSMLLHRWPQICNVYKRLSSAVYISVETKFRAFPQIVELHSIVIDSPAPIFAHFSFRTRNSERISTYGSLNKSLSHSLCPLIAESKVHFYSLVHIIVSTCRLIKTMCEQHSLYIFRFAVFVKNKLYHLIAANDCFSVFFAFSNGFKIRLFGNHRTRVSSFCLLYSRLQQLSDTLVCGETEEEGDGAKIQHEIETINAFQSYYMCRAFNPHLTVLNVVDSIHFLRSIGGTETGEIDGFASYK